MRLWLSGTAPACQVGNEGSIPSSRTNIPADGLFGRRTCPREASCIRSRSQARRVTVRGTIANAVLAEVDQRVPEEHE